MVAKTFNNVTDAALTQTPNANIVTMQTETGETLLVAQNLDLLPAFGIGFDQIACLNGMHGGVR